MARYKYIVDGEWLYNINEKTEQDASGNVNNVMVIQ